MPTYQDWNNALANYFLQGIAKGSRVYLSVDDTTLQILGSQDFSQHRYKSWREDCIAAVRCQVVKGDRLNLERIEGYNSNYDIPIPNCVTFLAVCVLAAYDMASDEEITDTNYFQRLREVLKLPTFDRAPHLKETSPRPRGMEVGTEERLWKTWNKWLQSQDFLPSAKVGSSRRNKYINYPISQCLLRKGDRDQLVNYFAQECLKSSLDAQKLFNKIRMDLQQFKIHLQDLIKDSDRRDILIDIIQEIHQEWLEAGCPSSKNDYIRKDRLISPTLFAGLLRREEDYEIEYYPYPKQKTRQKCPSITVQYEIKDKPYTAELRQDRPGWYEYIDIPLSARDLCHEQEYKILYPESFKKVKLSTRDFWLLIPDQDHPDTGIYASWRATNCQEPFIFCCKETLLEDLENIQNSRLVDWSEEYYPFEEDNTWIELHEFRILSSQWQDLSIKNHELSEFIQSQPITQLSISFSSGLRSPNQKAWLQGHQPVIKILGEKSKSKEKLQLFKLPDEDSFDPSDMNLKPGEYIVYLKNANRNKERSLKIIDWNELIIQKISLKSCFSVDLPRASINGTLINQEENNPILDKVKDFNCPVQDFKSWRIGFNYFGKPESLIDSIFKVITDSCLEQFIELIELFQKKISKRSKREFSFFLTLKSEAVGKVPEKVQSQLFSLPFFSRSMPIPDWGETVSQNKKIIADIVGNSILFPYPLLKKSTHFSDEIFNNLSVIKQKINSNDIKLLDWLSAKGHGSWATFQTVCQSLDIEHPSRVLRKLKLLGHIETSPNGKKWAIAPTALVPLNHDSENLEFYLCGQQNTRFREALEERAEINMEGQPVTFGLPRFKVIFSDRATYDQLEKFDDIPIHKPGNIAQRLAEYLPTIQEWQASLLEVGGIVKSQRYWRRYQPESRNWQDYGLPDQTGLYEMRHEADQSHPGRTFFYEADTDSWRQSDWYGLRFLALHHSNTLQDCVYRPEQKQLAILAAERWPQLYERALVLASGYLPSWHNTHDQTWLIYRNITSDLAYYLTELLSLTCQGL